jgi:CRP-like cAMP-binding protein
MSWTKNRLLSILPRPDAALLRPRLEPVSLAQGEMLFRSNERISHVFFFEGGLSSEIAGNDETKKIEVGCIGYEGFSAVPAVLGVDSSPHYAFMQCAGPALRIGVDELRTVMEESRSVRELLLKYAHVFLIQVAATALADGRYDIEQRLARWILMSQDRVGEDLPLTHDFLALMLGVRRSSVTDALHRLEGTLAIKAERSLISVRDRETLKAIAGPSYGMPEQEYERHLGQDWRAR